jgi:hypothetical protein
MQELVAIDLKRFNDIAQIEFRVNAVSKKERGSLRSALRYLYEDDGPVNLLKARLRVAQPHLEEAERIVTRWLHPRTNGHLRKSYGPDALRAARASRYRCEHCGFADVRVLNLDHVNGRVAGALFACLCANCHAIKSRKFDWTGEKRQPTFCEP